MDAKPLDFLQALLATPSPSGYEQPIQAVVRQVRGRICRRSAERSARQPDRRSQSAGRAARDAGRPLRSNRFFGAVYRRRRFYLDSADRRLGPASADRPENDHLAQRGTDLRRGGPQADPPAHRRRAKGGAQAQGFVARHRGQRQGASRGTGLGGRSGDAGAGLSPDAGKPGQLAGHGQQDRLVGGDRGPAPHGRQKAQLCGCTPCRPWPRKSACAGQ